MPLTVARKERLLEAFRRAGRRGLTAAEMASHGGDWSRLRLSELRDEGYVFVEIPSKRRPGTTFRWILTAEPTVVPDDDAQASLFAAPAPAPDSAIGGE